MTTIAPAPISRARSCHSAVDQIRAPSISNRAIARIGIVAEQPCEAAGNCAANRSAQIRDGVMPQMQRDETDCRESCHRHQRERAEFARDAIVAGAAAPARSPRPRRARPARISVAARWLRNLHHMNHNEGALTYILNEIMSKCTNHFFLDARVVRMERARNRRRDAGELHRAHAADAPRFRCRTRIRAKRGPARPR